MFNLLKRVSARRPWELCSAGIEILASSVGGVARGGQDDLPMGKANLLDKVIGKTEKVWSCIARYFISLTLLDALQVIGKATGNADRHEAGELREAGGKKAVTGEARAPHDKRDVIGLCNQLSVSANPDCNGSRPLGFLLSMNVFSRAAPKKGSFESRLQRYSDSPSNRREL